MACDFLELSGMSNSVLFPHETVCTDRLMVCWDRRTTRCFLIKQKSTSRTASQTKEIVPTVSPVDWILGCVPDITATGVPYDISLNVFSLPFHRNSWIGY